MTKRRYIVNFVVIIILGVLSGYFVGSYIAGGKLVALSNSYNERVLRMAADSESENTELPTYYTELPASYFAGITGSVEGKTPDRVSAITAFMAAEYYTNTSDYIYKNISGNIVAKSMGLNVNQGLAAKKIKKDGTIYLDKVSYSNMAKVAKKVEHTIGSGTYLDYKGNANADLTATWNAPQEKQISEYREFWGSGIDYFTNYIVTPKTVLASGCSAVKAISVTAFDDYYKEGQTYYRFSMALDIRINEETGDFVYGAVSNYMYEIKNTANADGFPVFSYCTLTVTIDSNFRFVEIDIEERYQVKAYGFNADTTARQTEKFRYCE